MANRPSLPTRNFSFTDYTINTPNSPHPGTYLDSNYDSGFTYLAGVDIWIASIISDTGALKSNVVFKDNVDPALYAEWEIDLLASVQPSVDEAASSAATAQISETNTAASAAAASDDADTAVVAALAAGVSETDAANSAGLASTNAIAAASSAAAAVVSASDSEGDAAAAAISEQASFLWAEFMDGPVKAEGSGSGQPAVGDGYYSARWWANYAEIKSNLPGKIVEETYQIDGIGNIWTDTNLMDFSGQTSDGSTCVNIGEGTSYVFAHSGNLYKYTGPPNVCIGVGGTYTVLDGDMVQTSTTIHNGLTDRDAIDAHPILAITGLIAALAAKSDVGHLHDSTELPNAGWVEKAGDTMQGHLTMEDAKALVMEGVGGVEKGRMYIGKDKATGTVDEVLLASASSGARVNATSIHLDAPVVRMSVVGAAPADNVVVAGLTGTGDAILGYSTPTPDDHGNLSGRSAADSHPQSAITGLLDAIKNASRVEYNTSAVAFSVLVDQIRTQFYRVTAPVLVTIPAGLVQGEQFTVQCVDAGVTFTAPTYAIEQPSSKLVQPFEAYSSITFTCVTSTVLSVTGDLADA